MDTEQARTNMITQQLRTWDVLNEAVLQAVKNTPREDFVPAAYKNLAFADMNIPLAHGQLMLTPKEEARLLQALNLQLTETVLEIGTGSAYMTALLAQLTKWVHSIDIFPDFIQQAHIKLAMHNINNVSLLSGDAARGWEQQGPYDAIIITGALPFLPESFRNSLKPGGRLIAIIGQAPAMTATLIKRSEHSKWSEEKLFETVIPTLVNAEQLPAFTF